MSLAIDDLAYFLDGQSTSSIREQQVSQILSTSTNGIEGLPYQFMDTVDRRISGTDVGRKYTEKIFNRLPLLFLAPCEPMFMDTYNKEQQNVVADLLFSAALGKDINAAGTILSAIADEHPGRYYSVDFAYNDYYKYLNTMLTCVATYMGLYDKKIVVAGKETSLGQVAWQNELNQAFKSFFSAKENLIFYLDGFDTVSESFSNDTTESSLASTINGYSDQLNEIKFLFGEDGTNAASALLGGASEATTSISQALSKGLGFAGGGLIESLSSKGIDAALHGGKIIFPEIWSNSDFSRSYNLDIKLRTPDHDSLSIFLNILKPYCKILALTLPREYGDDPNTYSSPFLVRAYCKGKFNIEMGMISSISVNKGATGCWNDDGLPTQLDISIEIKDLYSKMSMPKVGVDDDEVKVIDWNQFSNIGTVVNNTAYQDFLANMSGLNVGQMEIGRKISMIYYLTKASIARIPSTICTQFDQDTTRLMHRVYNFQNI